MIEIENFKNIFDILPIDTEIEFFFINKKHSYMIIKYETNITFQRCGRAEEQSGEIKYNTLEELLSSNIIDDICLSNEWANIEDIVIDALVSVDEKGELEKYLKLISN